MLLFARQFLQLEDVLLGWSDLVFCCVLEVSRLQVSLAPWMSQVALGVERLLEQSVKHMPEYSIDVGSHFIVFGGETFSTK